MLKPGGMGQDLRHGRVRADGSPPLWITWQDHRRTRELADAFGARLHLLLSGAPKYLRQILLGARTVASLLRLRPRLLIVQNPSLALAALATALRPLMRYRLVVDRHTNFMLDKPPTLYKTLYTAISDRTLRGADLTIVTNPFLARHVEERGGRAVVLHDRLPRLSSSGRPPGGDGFDVVFVCSYAADEPYREVARAASRLPSGFRVHFTGNPSRALGEADFSDLVTSCGAVVLTGYLAEQEYVDLLGSADLVMDLTTLSHCLVCGAYEAAALGRPLVLSDSEANRDLFGDHVFYVDPTADSIREGILAARAALASRRRDPEGLRMHLAELWSQRFARVRAEIDRLRRGGRAHG